MRAEKRFVEQTCNIVEGLCCLNYMISEDADRPEKVRYYANLSERRLQMMIELLQRSCSMEA
jgi:hypothetical protein